MKFKTLRKVNDFFEKRLNTIVNTTTERVRLPCPFSRVSELIILDKCISLRGKNVVKKLDNLYERHEKLIKQIKQENMDFKAIVARQGRELVSGKVRNVKVLYESEIYLLTMSVSHANAQLQNNKNEIEEVEEENQKMKSFYTNYLQKIDLTEMKETVKEITQLQTECELIESEIDQIESQLANNDSNDEIEKVDNDDYENKNLYNKKSRKSNRGYDFDDENKISNSNSNSNQINDFDEENNLNNEKSIIEAKTNIASLKSLPWLVHNIFNKLINE